MVNQQFENYKNSEKCVMPTYGRKPVVFVEGSGIRVKDSTGTTYQDWVGGVAVNCLGHGSPVIQEAINEQAGKLMHVSNLYWNEPQLELANLLVLLSDGCLDEVFFCNSGTESLECALKIVKKHGASTDKPYVLYMKNSFHGRTSGALSITGQAKYQEPFGDLIPGCLNVDFNDTIGLKNRLGQYAGKIAGIFVEPIQGEGGVIVAEPEFLSTIAEYCKENDALLVFDEVQCGAGRLGTYYAYQTFGVIPDVVCMAKGLGGGIPIGATLVGPKAKVLGKGDHGSTYGGNPLATAVALAVTKTVSDPAFLQGVRIRQGFLEAGLAELAAKGLIKDHRGKGLLQGIVVDNPSALVDKAFENGILFISAGNDTVRLLPPLNVALNDICQLIENLQNLLKD